MSDNTCGNYILSLFHFSVPALRHSKVSKYYDLSYRCYLSFYFCIKLYLSAFRSPYRSEIPVQIKNQFALIGVKVTYMKFRKEKSVKDITELEADKQTFSLVQDGVTTQITVKEYFEEKRKVPLK